MTRWSAAAVFVACAGLLVFAQGPSGADAVVTLTGVVVSDGDGSVLTGVHVSLVTNGAIQDATLTDSFGRFVLPAAASNRYQLAARKAGYLQGGITLSAGELPARITLHQGAVISGRVVDDTGEPILQAFVMAATRDGAFPQTGLTDDRGEYRLFVEPRQPLILIVTTSGLESARMTNGRVSIEAPVHKFFYPGADVVDQAIPQELEPGELRDGLNFTIGTAESVRQPFRGLESVASVLGLVADLAPSDATAVIQGRVRDTGSRAVPNALVILAPERPGAPMRMTRADEAGRFEFREVAPGSVRVMGSKAGHEADEARPVITNQTGAVPVTLQLTPWGSISGRVLDEFGEPVQGAFVQVMRRRYDSGRRVLVAANGVTPRTDERGAYRVYGLAPGTYAVSVPIDGAQVASPANTGFFFPGGRTYFPGTANPAGAEFITLGAGQDRNDIEVTLPRNRSHRVSGRVLDSSGMPATVGSLRLWPSQETNSTVGVPFDARPAPDGRFEFQNVPDGRYVIQSYRGRANSATEGEFGATVVTVSGGDVSGLTVTTSPGSTIAGTVLFESSDPSRTPSRVDIELTPVPGDLDLAPASNWATAGVGTDWRFSFQGISGPRRIVPTRLPRGWMVKAVRVNGVEIDDGPMPFGRASQSISNVEVLLTDQLTRLGGRVVNGRGQPAVGVWVCVFGTTPARWYPSSPHIRRTVTQADGSFLVEGMPPGSYYVAMLPPAAVVDEGWQDPATLDNLIPNATFVTIDEVPRSPIELRVQQSP